MDEQVYCGCSFSFFYSFTTSDYIRLRNFVGNSISYVLTTLWRLVGPSLHISTRGGEGICDYIWLKKTLFCGFGCLVVCLSVCLSVFVWTGCGGRNTAECKQITHQHATNFHSIAHSIMCWLEMIWIWTEWKSWNRNIIILFQSEVIFFLSRFVSQSTGTNGMDHLTLDPNVLFRVRLRPKATPQWSVSVTRRIVCDATISSGFWWWCVD